MSAWICTRKHIAAVAKAAAVLLDIDAMATANALNLENHRSVSYRYRQEDETPVPFEREELEAAQDLTTNPTALLKAVNCLEYQSCEHPGWGNSASEHLLYRLKGRANELGAIGSGPAYNAEAWGIR